MVTTERAKLPVISGAGDMELLSSLLIKAAIRSMVSVLAFKAHEWKRVLANECRL